MLHTRLGINDTKRYDADGYTVRGHELVGEDHIVRWFSLDELLEMTPVGVRGAWGYNAYADADS